MKYVFEVTVSQRAIAFSGLAEVVGTLSVQEAAKQLRMALKGSATRILERSSPESQDESEPLVRPRHQVYLDAIRAAAGLPEKFSSSGTPGEGPVAIVALLNEAGVDAVKVGMVPGS